MGLKLKCVSIEATLKCTQVNGTTTFIKTSNITQVDGVELATTANIDIEAFKNLCDSGCFGGGSPCNPNLEGWMLIASRKAVNGKELLTEKSINKCNTKNGFITIEDVKQSIVVIDMAQIILDAIHGLNPLLDFRLNQFNNDPDDFKACFEKWFGKGHSNADVQSIVDRIKSVKAYTAKMVNADGSLNENFFEIVNTPDDYDTNAYVFSNKIKDKVIHLAPGSFSPNKPTSGFGTLSGTIAHELSHFEDIGKTDDLAYWGKVQPLAKTDPDKALNNAASFSFFLESGVNCDDY